MTWKLDDLQTTKPKRNFHFPKLPLKLIVLVISLCLIGVGVGYGLYTLTSNIISGTPLTSAGAVLLVANSTAPLSGDTLQLTATITSGLGVSGWSVQLYNNDVSVGSPVVTNGAGTAVFNQVVTAAYAFKVVATKA